MVFTEEEEKVLKLIISETRARIKMNIERENMTARANPLQLKVIEAQNNLKESFKESFKESK